MDNPQLLEAISHERLRARIDRNCQLLHLARWLPPSPKRRQPLLSVRRPKVLLHLGLLYIIIIITMMVGCRDGESDVVIVRWG